ncbi:MAG TPA: hypothetical protein PLP50_13945 [Thermoanaerobaculia bacterium]|nr:hypothetical protein [Thermoanaerobaculia bacterium]HPA52692.1 hypothetical protein [Thermoanaerobaculia bacterium]HQN07936.1 hypothetical protein [Thermoanaerobaculia bacterium]HQP85427.1 hypothetical protein [Thermoanaerobaculia bacterium]
MSDTLLHEVLDVLQRRGTPAALIGAVAPAAHGIVRATLDYDLLDAETLLDGEEAGRLRAEVESRLEELPEGLRREVSALLARRTG